MIQITDEMPETWVRALAEAVEGYGYEIEDAHEAAIVVELPTDAAQALHADEDQDKLVIGWSGDDESDEPGTVHWGLSGDAAYISEPETFADETDEIDTIAARVHRLLRTGRTEPRQVQHAVPYAEISDACRCPTAYPCRGIVPAADCPEHGGTRAPAMSWHWEETCI